MASPYEERVSRAIIKAILHSSAAENNAVSLPVVALAKTAGVCNRVLMINLSFSLNVTLAIGVGVANPQARRLNVPIGDHL